MTRVRDMRPDHRRILRLALGVAMAMAFSQALNWPMSFVAPLITAMMLTLPLPAPTLRQSIIFIGALIGSLCIGLLIIPFLEFAPATGILLMGLVLFASFLFTAKGGSPLLGTFLTVGMTVLAAIGSLSVDEKSGLCDPRRYRCSSTSWRRTSNNDVHFKPWHAKIARYYQRKPDSI